jgi:hypothetical protein
MNETRTPRQALSVAITALVVFAIGGGLAGCRSAPDQVSYARTFPPGLKQSETLNIQVFRRETRVELTNTSARAFSDFTLWLNRRFSRPITSFDVGQTLDLPLSEFRDEFSEKFRGGGFFAAEAPEHLVQAQIEAKGVDGKPVLLGLVVVAARE